MKFLVCVHSLMACFRGWCVFDFANGVSCVFVNSVKFEAKLEDGTVVGKSDGVEFTVKDG